MSSRLRLVISTPTEKFIDVNIDSFTVEVKEGYITILLNHLPFISSLPAKQQLASYKIGRKKSFIYMKKGGLVILKNNTINVAVEQIWKK